MPPPAAALPRATNTPRPTAASDAAEFLTKLLVLLLQLRHPLRLPLDQLRLLPMTDLQHLQPFLQPQNQGQQLVRCQVLWWSPFHPRSLPDQAQACHQQSTHIGQLLLRDSHRGAEPQRLASGPTTVPPVGECTRTAPLCFTRGELSAISVQLSDRKGQPRLKQSMAVLPRSVPSVSSPI